MPTETGPSMLTDTAHEKQQIHELGSRRARFALFAVFSKPYSIKRRQIRRRMRMTSLCLRKTGDASVRGKPGSLSAAARAFRWKRSLPSSD
jgi:hypothetical protein